MKLRMTSQSSSGIPKSSPNTGTRSIIIGGIILVIYTYHVSMLATMHNSFSHGIKVTVSTSIVKSEFSYDNANHSAKIEPLKEEEVVENPLRKAYRSNQTIILYWYQPWRKQMANSVLGKECGNCIITAEKTKIFHRDTAAVVFHFNELSKKTMPKMRNPNHTYVYLSMENPAITLASRHLREVDDQFNWIMSYRRDADVYVPHYTMPIILSYINKRFRHTEDAGISWIMKQKRRLVLWVVSNCRTNKGASDRMKLVREMMDAGIRIVGRGRCFPRKPPPPGDWHGTTKQLKFFTSAKFYIAFENNHHCKDYITEKLYRNAFLAGAVPIVWGPRKEDYEAVVPRHSCIFMDDYMGNLSKLADYLDYLDKNDTAYKEYLSWRITSVKDEELGLKNVFPLSKRSRQAYRNCKLCQVVTGMNTTDPHSPKHSKKIKSVESWFYDNEEAECLGSKFESV